MLVVDLLSLTGFNYREEEKPKAAFVNKIKHISGKSTCLFNERVAKNILVFSFLCFFFTHFKQVH